MRRLPRLYGIADRAFGDPVSIGLRLFAGGARLVQIRDKGASSRVLLAEVVALLEAAPRGAVVLVNDRADVARLAGAGGVHVGQADLPASHVRRIVGSGMLAGLSTHDSRQARFAQDLPVDYIAAGPVFRTASKANAEPAIGLAGLARICRSSRLPVVAIGGIRLEDAPRVLEAGASSVAVLSGILGHSDIEARTREYVDLLRRLSVGTDDAPRANDG